MPWNTPLTAVQLLDVKLTQFCVEGTQHAPLQRSVLHTESFPMYVPPLLAQLAKVCTEQLPLPMQHAPVGIGQLTAEHVVPSP
jgi:hypothetical protein